MIRAGLVALALVLGLPAPVGAASCRQALALALDVSGSVDTDEYRLQIGGLAAALRHPDVVRALLAMPDSPVRIAVFEWSGPDFQRLLLDWTEITDAATLEVAANRVWRTTRVKAPPSTALGTALTHAAALLDGQRGCWKRTLDVSGDGKQNTGPHPRDIRPVFGAAGVTVNALVIGTGGPVGDAFRETWIAELSAYFDAYVITGPGAFVETALDFDDYEAAMVRKLLRELTGPVLSGLPSAVPDTAGPRRP